MTQEHPIDIFTLFPQWVSVAFAYPEDEQEVPEERTCLTQGASPNRIRDFRLGRIAAKRALKNLGFLESILILRDDFGAPIFPKGYIGSISHSAESAIASVCLAENAEAIGVDIQKVREISPEVIERVTTKGEQDWIGGNLVRGFQIFSAKESVVKAAMSLFRRSIVLSSFELIPSEENQFTVSFENKVRILSKVMVQDNFIIAFAFSSNVKNAEQSFQSQS